MASVVEMNNGNVVVEIAITRSTESVVMAEINVNPAEITNLVTINANTAVNNVLVEGNLVNESD